uniref:Ubiquitin-like domain-containing protein n=1 Tax=Parastrongyloides trichosuri TaxID=131310 RepID=A0A0N4ZMU0_PARTI
MDIAIEDNQFLDLFSTYSFIAGCILLIFGFAYLHATWAIRNDSKNIDKLAWIVEEITLTTRNVIRVIPLTERQIILASSSSNSRFISDFLRNDPTGISRTSVIDEPIHSRKHILVVYGPKTADRNQKFYERIRVVGSKRCYFWFNKTDTVYDIMISITKVANFALALLVSGALSEMRNINNFSYHQTMPFTFSRVLYTRNMRDDVKHKRHSIERRNLNVSDVRKSYIKRFCSKKGIKDIVKCYTGWIPDDRDKEENIKKYTEMAIDKYSSIALNNKLFKAKMEIVEKLIEKYPHILEEEGENPYYLKSINRAAKKYAGNIIVTDRYVEEVIDGIYKETYERFKNEKDGKNDLENITSYSSQEEEDLVSKKEAPQIRISNTSTPPRDPQSFRIGYATFGDFTNRTQTDNTQSVYSRSFTSRNNINSLFDQNNSQGRRSIPSFVASSSPNTYSGIRRISSENSNDSDEEIFRGYRFTNIGVNSSISTFFGNNTNFYNNTDRDINDIDSEISEVNSESSHIMGSSSDDTDEAFRVESESEDDEGHTIRLKFLNDYEKIVPFLKNMKVGDFKQLHFREAVENNKVIRLIFAGQLLRDDKRKLGFYGLVNGSVLHVHISEVQLSNTTNNENFSENERNTGGVQYVTSSDDDGIPEQRVFTSYLFNLQRQITGYLLARLLWLRNETENADISSTSFFYQFYVIYMGLLNLAIRIFERWEAEGNQRLFDSTIGELVGDNFSSLLILVIFPPMIYLCTSSGVCGCGQTQHCGCNRARAMSTPTKRCIDENCSPGYSCGEYGCARSRMHGSVLTKDGLLISDDEFVNKTNLFKNILTPNMYNKKNYLISSKDLDMMTFQKITNPNFLFKQCCEGRKLPDSCLMKCNFNSFTISTLHNMALGYDECPINAGADMLYCGGQGRDHRECCRKRGVSNTLAGDKCLVFCDQRPGRISNLDYSYISCIDKLETIKSCFYEEVKSHAENLLLDKLINS